jgi:succinoglycan biosynthesis transport protein ExoP
VRREIALRRPMSQPTFPQPPSDEDRLDLRAYLRPVWRWKWVVVLIVGIATAGTYFLSSRQPKQYVSSTPVYIVVADPAAAVGSPQLQLLGPPSAQNMQDLATAQSVAAAVYQRLHLPLGSAGYVSVAPLGGSAGATSFLVVTATSSSPTLAARLANTYVAVFLDARRSAQAAQALSDADVIRRALRALPNTPANAAERQTLLTQDVQYRTTAANPSAGARQINPAVAPTAPTSPKPVHDAILGGIVGLLLGIAAAFGLELLDRRLVRVSSVESIYGLPVLAVLPHVRRPTPTRDGHAMIPPAFVEPMRSLRINVGMATGVSPRRTLLVTSGVAGEGKSTVVRDLALVCAEAGEAVLVIDADLRRPSIAKLLGVEPQLGLAQVLRREVVPAQAIVPVHRPGPYPASRNGSNGAAPTGDPRLRGSIDLLSYGERVANPVGLLGSVEMRSTLAAAIGRYDTVILDSAPLLVVADTVPLLEMVDAVILVARLGLTTRDSADRLATLLQRVPKTNLAGVVTNDMRGTFLEGGYGGYGYGYGSRARAATTGTG